MSNSLRDPRHLILRKELTEFIFSLWRTNPLNIQDETLAFAPGHRTFISGANDTFAHIDFGLTKHNRLKATTIISADALQNFTFYDPFLETNNFHLCFSSIAENTISADTLEFIVHEIAQFPFPSVDMFMQNNGTVSTRNLYDNDRYIICKPLDDTFVKLTLVLSQISCEFVFFMMLQNIVAEMIHNVLSLTRNIDFTSDLQVAIDISPDLAFAIPSTIRSDSLVIHKPSNYYNMIFGNMTLQTCIDEYHRSSTRLSYPQWLNFTKFKLFSVDMLDTEAIDKMINNPQNTIPYEFSYVPSFTSAPRILGVLHDLLELTFNLAHACGMKMFRHTILLTSIFVDHIEPRPEIAGEIVYNIDDLKQKFEPFVYNHGHDHTPLPSDITSITLLPHSMTLGHRNRSFNFPFPLIDIFRCMGIGNTKSELRTTTYETAMMMNRHVQLKNNLSMHFKTAQLFDNVCDVVRSRMTHVALPMHRVSSITAIGVWFMMVRWARFSNTQINHFVDIDTVCGASVFHASAMFGVRSTGFCRFIDSLKAYTHTLDYIHHIDPAAAEIDSSVTLHNLAFKDSAIDLSGALVFWDNRNYAIYDTSRVMTKLSQCIDDDTVVVLTRKVESNKLRLRQRLKCFCEDMMLNTVDREQAFYYYQKFRNQS